VVAIDIHFYPVAGKIIPQAQALHDGRRLRVKAWVGDAEILFVVKYLKAALPGWRRIFRGLVPDKILAPGHGIPGGLIGDAVRLYRAAQSFGSHAAGAQQEGAGRCRLSITYCTTGKKKNRRQAAFSS
jgi:hypothetical protein